MSKYIPGNQKHLSLEDRKYIERSLNNGTSFKDIARFLCKDPTTISKEVKLHRLSDWYHKGKQMYVARQIITNHPELDMSIRTLYSYLDDGSLTARNIDLKPFHYEFTIYLISYFSNRMSNNSFPFFGSNLSGIRHIYFVM